MAIRFESVDPLDASAQDAMRRYFAELDVRFPDGFDAGDAATADASSLSPPTGVFLLVRVGRDVAGAGGLQRIDATTAEVKRMWIHPDHRGIGLARRLLSALEDEAGVRGHTRVVLDTNGVLTEAIALYESAGYDSIERYNDNPYAQRWFAKVITATR